MKPKELKQFEESLNTVIRIENTVKSDNFDYSLLLPQKPKSVNLPYLIASIILYIVATLMMLLLFDHSDKVFKALFVFGSLSILWVSCCVHLRFKSYTVTGIVPTILLIIFLVSCNIVAPREAAKDMRTIWAPAVQ
jgi:hypothetical protein